ncbi:MAG TPA: toxin TcdB middle/C-terminal domain-containing protein, partial [Burkholderiales bacterium]|nr:toxin TcdB middle/C-terminal domain-containing protein [Burkholderiales bacterium]
EALRACKGMVLRREVYELDGPALSGNAPRHLPTRLFSVATHNCRIRKVQGRGPNRHAVFLVTESEALTYHHELDLSGAAELKPDPRIAHALHLRHDEYGQPQQSVSVGYGRWAPGDHGALPRPDLITAVQAETHLACTEIRYTQDVLLPAASAGVTQPRPALRHHRLRLPCETLSYELKGIVRADARYYAPADFARLRLSDLYGPLDATAPAVAVTSRAYHDQAIGTAPQSRLVEHTRTLYFDDASDVAAPSGALPFGRLGPRGLKYEDYKLALTDALLAAVFGRADAQDPMADRLAWRLAPGVTPRTLLAEAARSGYVPGASIEPTLQGQYWMRSGTAGFAADARRHFYLPERYRDAFGGETTLAYDERDLYVRSSRDAKGNTVRIERFDHRLLAPVEMVDAHGNHSAVAHDLLGRVVAAASQGKNRAVPGAPPDWEGDHLGGFDFALCNKPSAEVRAFCSAPTLDATRTRQWLAGASVRFVYHFGEAIDDHGIVAWATRPAGACAIAREIHASQPGSANSPLQVSLECADGAGQALMTKQQAEPERTDGPLRWIVNGLTVLNNKGKPVRQFEPAFSVQGFGCETPQANGVSTTMFYDAAGRVVRTEFPDGTLARVRFTPWQVEAWDQNDTVLESAWYHSRNSLPPADALARTSAGLYRADPGQRAGWLAARHANTPARTILDSLGREVIAIAHNRVPSPSGPLRYAGRNWKDEFQFTYSKLDAEGKPLWIRDPRGNLVMQYITPTKPVRWTQQRHENLPRGAAPAYDLAGNLLFQHSMDAGPRWLLSDAAGQPMLAWDANDRQEDNGGWFEERRLYV